MKNEIAKTTETALAVEAPRGFEKGIDKEDLIIPRAKLVQLQSDECTQLNIKMGSLVNSLTKEVLPSEFIPVFFNKSWVRFNPRNEEDPNFDASKEPGEMIWRSDDPNDPRVLTEAKFGASGEPPLALTMLNFLVYFPGCEMPLILSFAKTSFKAGKQLLSMCQFSGGDMFSHKYKITTEVAKNKKGTYAVMKVTQSGKPSEEEYKKALEIYNSFSKKPIKTDETEF